LVKPKTQISVVGLGKLGCPIAACFAHKGWDVIGVDRESSTVDAINQGVSPIFEPGLQDLLDEAKGNLQATLDCSRAVADTDITFIIVPTPTGLDGNFSNRFVLGACQDIGKGLAAKGAYHLVVLSSTVMPGSTGGEVRRVLEESSGKTCGVDFGLCYGPTFVALGSVIRDILNPDYLLVGESDTTAGEILQGLYENLCENDPPVARMNFINAELAKLANNTYVSTKITFGNMLSQICEQLLGADVDVVTAAMGLDSRIGAKYLRGGLGYGGPCLVRDNVALSSLANRIGASAHLSEATHWANTQETCRLVDLIKSKRTNGGTVGVLGLSYKPQTDVVEDSQGLLLAQTLTSERIPVVVYDPEAMNAARHHLDSSVHFADSAEDCIHRSEVVVIATPWSQFSAIKPEIFGPSGARVLVDCWRIFDRKTYAPIVEYVALGVGLDPGG